MIKFFIKSIKNGDFMNLIINSNYDPSTYLIAGGDREARKLFDPRTKSKIIFDKFTVAIREVGCVLSGFLPTCSKPNNIYKIYENPVWRDKSAGLYVLIHGLEAHPSEWNERIELLTKHANAYDIYAPSVVKAGNCSLKEASNPIVKKVISYAKEFPLNPIFVIGESNGGRIATVIDIELRKQAPTNPMKISTIAGVHFGTSRVNFSQKYKLNLISDVVSSELSYGSPTARKLINALQTVNPKDPPRSYEIFAGTEDWLVPDLALMKLPQQIPTEYHIIHRFGHLTMMHGIVQQQMNAADIWMKMNQPQDPKKRMQQAHVPLINNSINSK